MQQQQPGMGHITETGEESVVRDAQWVKLRALHGTGNENI